MAETALIHGRSVTFVEAGQGPALLLIHGITGDWRAWREVIEPLTRTHTVIAPDLPGHGASDPGPGDYSVGGLAAGLRDLLMARGHDRATVVGHSLGGGVAMQFAYQFPEAVERLVLVSSGGLGQEVSPILRSGALPGANPFIATTAVLGKLVDGPVRRALAAIGIRLSVNAAEIAHGYASLADPRRRAAFLATLRCVVGIAGQRVSATDRLYLAEMIPVLVVWGARDPLIPVHHAEEAHQAIPGSRLEVFERAKHFPQLEDPVRFIEVLEGFLAETEPASFERDEWRQRLKDREGGV